MIELATRVKQNHEPMESVPQSPSLYAQVLGPQWSELSDPVRRLHTPGAIIDATGTFQVCRGNFIARLLASLARLPCACDAVNLRLIVTPSSATEEWRRIFDDRPLVSTQWFADGALAEWMGTGETHFRLRVVDGALIYDAMSMALRLGPLRLWMPRFLMPKVYATERAIGDAVEVAVSVHLPLMGLLIAYEGTLTQLEGKPC